MTGAWRLAAALACALLAGSAWAQPGPAPAISQLRTQPGNNADLLSLKNQAPRRSRMSLSATGALTGQKQTFSAGVTYTYLTVTPIETQAYAVKIGLANPFSGTMQVLSAGLYFSDSYSGIVQGGVQNFTANTTAIPTANSVYQSCTTTSGSATVVCSNTALLPSAATMYAIGPGMPINGTATVASGTNLTLSANATASATVTLQFANLATECKLYYDNTGADVDTINTAGVSRTLAITGPPGNSGAGPYPFTLQWSDFVPCTSKARADGGTQPVAFVFVTLGPSTTTWGYTSSTLPTYNGTAAAIVGNRYIFSGRPWSNGGTDYADNPAGSGWTATTIPMTMELSYLTDSRGWNILQVGDSISGSPPDDNLSTPVFRACKLLSTPQAPCEWSSVAFGGQASPIYDENLRNNIGALRPSAIVGQPISRNDPGGATLASYQMLWAKLLSYTEKADARIGLYGAFPFTTTVDALPTAQADIATMAARMAAISKSCQPSSGGQTCPMVPVLDPVPVLSRAALGGNAWDYLGMLNTANGASAAGVTSIPITTQGGAVGCLPGDVLTDTTTAGVITAGALVTSATTTALTVPGGTVIGSGIVDGDRLVCSYPGWGGGFLTQDNTHPWYPSILLLQPAANVFTQQLLGLQ